MRESLYLSEEANSMMYLVSEKAQRFMLNCLLHLSLKRGSLSGDFIRTFFCELFIGCCWTYSFRDFAVELSLQVCKSKLKPYKDKLLIYFTFTRLESPKDSRELPVYTLPVSLL